MTKTKELFESYSNLAYNATGFIALICFNDVLLCFAMQALGIASFIYHYNKSPDRDKNVIWQFDWWAMSAVNTIVTGMLFNDPNVWIGLFAWHVFYSYKIMGKLHVFLDVALSAAPALFAIYINRSFLTFSVVLGLFLVAVLLRSKDKDPKQLQFHDSVWHSIWHIITSPIWVLAIYLDKMMGI